MLPIHLRILFYPVFNVMFCIFGSFIYRYKISNSSSSKQPYTSLSIHTVHVEDDEEMTGFGCSEENILTLYLTYTQMSCGLLLIYTYVCVCESLHNLLLFKIRYCVS